MIDLTTRQERLARLKRMIEIRAPENLLFMFAKTFLVTKYDNSYYRMGWALIREQVLFDVQWYWESLRLFWYVHIRRMDREAALDVIFGTFSGEHNAD